MQIRIFLDCSASMGKETPQKAAYAVATAAAFGFLSVHNMDKVSYQAHARKTVRRIRSARLSEKTLSSARSASWKTSEFSEETDLEAAIKGCPNLGSTATGLTVIISDFFTDSDWKKAVDYLCYQQQQILLIQVLTPEEERPLLQRPGQPYRSRNPPIFPTKGI